MTFKTTLCRAMLDLSDNSSCPRSSAGQNTSVLRRVSGVRIPPRVLVGVKGEVFDLSFFLLWQFQLGVWWGGRNCALKILMSEEGELLVRHPSFTIALKIMPDQSGLQLGLRPKGQPMLCDPARVVG